MEKKILNEITNYCGRECGNPNNCSEDECVLYRIEKIIEPNLKEYEIEIEETLQKVIKVKAVSEEEACDKVYQQYKNQEIILESEDFKGYGIHLFREVS